MVDAVVAQGGIVDKYIDDAVMAIFGAPVKHEDDEIRSVRTAFAMIEAANEFNREQKKAGRPEFETSVGISYGVVTVGNIGCGKRMDYTVICDRVNLASRAQGMCRVYRQPLIFMPGSLKDMTPASIVAQPRSWGTSTAPPGCSSA
jgi:class 3 adenylate cyclase